MNPSISDESVSVDKLKFQYQGNGPGPGSSSQKSLFAALEQSEVWGTFYVRYECVCFNVPSETEQQL